MTFKHLNTQALHLAYLLTLTAVGATEGPVASFQFEDSAEFKTHWLTDNPVASSIESPRGEFGKAIDFSKTDGCLGVPYEPAQFKLGHLSETTGLTVAFWIKHKFEDRDGNHRIFTANGIDMAMTKGRDNLNFGIGGTASIRCLTHNLKLNPFDGEWHHIAITVDFSNSRENGILFVDGMATVPQDVSLLRDFNRADVNGRFIIGARNPGGSYPFRGSLDEIFFYDRPLSPHEVAHLVDGSLSAGVDQEIWLPQKAKLYGKTSATAKWSVAGPGKSKLGNSTATTTELTFDTPGDYTATFSEAGSGKKKSVKITVHPPAVPTVVIIAPVQGGYEPKTSYDLSAEITSPYQKGDTNFTWSHVSGPAETEIRIDKSSHLKATLRFPKPGLYEISGTSTIGKLSGSDHLQFLVQSAPPARHYTRLLSPTYSIDFDQPPSRSPLLTEAASGETGYKYFITSGPLPKLVPGARPFTGHAVDFTESECIGAVFNRHTNKDFGNLRSASGMGASFWIKGELPAPNANIAILGGVTFFADNKLEHAKGLRVRTKKNDYLVVPKDGETWNLFDNEWHHCTFSIDFTRKSGNVSIHIDGIERCSGDFSYENGYMDSMDVNRPSQWHHLAGRNIDFQTFNGALDDLAIFSRPLNTEDVKLLHEGPSAAQLSDLASAPTLVEAGSNQHHELTTSEVKLKGTLSNLHKGSTTEWTLLKGEGEAAFSSADQLETTVTLKHQFPSVNPNYGSYTFRLTSLSPAGVPTHDDVVVSIHKPIEKKARTLSAVPAPGVHPRILFSPEDLPAIRERCLNLPVAKASFARIKKISDRSLSATHVASGATYLALKEGKTIDVLPALATFKSDGAHNISGEAGSLYNIIYARSFIALIEKDQPKMQELSNVLSRLAAAHLTTYEPEYSNMLTHDACGVLGMAYDMLAMEMTEEQRRPVREILSRMTRFRQADGTSYEPSENCSNWKTFHDPIILAALAIEGEEGYDHRVFEDNIVKLRDFFTRYGVFPSGCAHEGWGYFNFGLNNASLSILATARRDENFFETTSLPGTLDMAFRNLATWSGAVRGNGDLPGGEINSPTALTQIAAWIYEDDAVCNYLEKAMEEGLVEGKKDPRNLHLLACIFGRDLSGAGDYGKATKPLPRDAFCKDTGYLSTRSSWDKDATHLVFRCRMDKFFLGHQHPDVNSFELWSHQRHWFIDPGKFEIENDRHATVLIDGIGGGGSLNWWTWPSMPGRFIYGEQSEDHVFGIGDAKNFYSYAVGPAKSPNGFVTDKLMESLGLSTEPVENPGLIWSDFTYPGTDIEALPYWRSQSISADFGYRGDTSKPIYIFNPVEKALRSAALYRNGPAFIVVTDDIKKDDKTHKYTWVANMLTDQIEVVSSGKDTLLLKHKSDPADKGPRMLVQLLGASGKTKLSLENFVIPASQSKVTRVDIEADDTVNPEFQVLLYPHKHGDPIPKIDTSAQSHQITIGEHVTTVHKGIASTDS